MYKFILSFAICFLISTASLFSQHIYDLSQYGIRPNSDKNTSPRRDVPYEMIKEINDIISTECAKMTGIKIAHHPTLTTEHLYDHVHADKTMLGC